MFCVIVLQIVDGVKNKEELRKNDVDLMKHSMNYSNNVEDIGFHHLNVVNVEKILQQLNPN